MSLTIELLIEWTGLEEEYLLNFYIQFRKEYSIGDNLESLQHNVLNFLKIYNKKLFNEKILFFENKIF